MGIVFFAFSAKKQGESVWQKSSETDDLLVSMLAYTADCRVAGGNISVKEMIRMCAESQTTPCGGSNETICEKANKTLNSMLSELKANVTDRPIHGYNLTVIQQGEGEIQKIAQPILVSIGNQTGNSFVSSVSIPMRYLGEVKISMKCWYSKTG
jgi:hypothetical protein